MNKSQQGFVQSPHVQQQHQSSSHSASPESPNHVSPTHLGPSPQSSHTSSTPRGALQTPGRSGSGMGWRPQSATKSSPGIQQRQGYARMTPSPPGERQKHHLPGQFRNPARVSKTRSPAKIATTPQKAFVSTHYLRNGTKALKIPKDSNGVPTVLHIPVSQRVDYLHRVGFREPLDLIALEEGIVRPRRQSPESVAIPDAENSEDESTDVQQQESQANKASTNVTVKQVDITASNQAQHLTVADQSAAIRPYYNQEWMKAAQQQMAARRIMTARQSQQSMVLQQVDPRPQLRPATALPGGLTPTNISQNMGSLQWQVQKAREIQSAGIYQPHVIGDSLCTIDRATGAVKKVAQRHYDGKTNSWLWYNKEKDFLFWVKEQLGGGGGNKVYAGCPQEGRNGALLGFKQMSEFPIYPVPAGPSSQRPYANGSNGPVKVWKTSRQENNVPWTAGMFATMADQTAHNKVALLTGKKTPQPEWQEMYNHWSYGLLDEDVLEGEFLKEWKPDIPPV